MTERLFNGKPFKRTNRLTRDVPMTPLEKLGDALERCIVGCQGRRNAERAQAVLDVIKEQGWTLTPPKEDDMPIPVWKVGDILAWHGSPDGIHTFRKITEVREGPAYSWHYCEPNGTTYGPEYISENSNDVQMIWGWREWPPKEEE